MMGVSCICPTFGRVELLKEAVKCFVEQDYEGESELLILNDASWITLDCCYPNVFVENLSYRIKDMGSKWNVLTALASHDVLIPWPDDDLMLPNAISAFVKLLGDKEYVHPKGRWTCSADGSNKNFTDKGAQGIIAYTKDAWWEVGGYPEMYSGQDTAFMRRLRNKYGSIEPQLDEDTAFFVYRWRGVPGHLSGRKTVDKWDALEDQMRRLTPPGVYSLEE